MISAARISNPLCNAQIKAMCKAKTAMMMVAFRLNVGFCGVSRFNADIPGGRPRDGMLWAEGNAGAVMWGTGKQAWSHRLKIPVGGQR